MHKTEDEMRKATTIVLSVLIAASFTILAFAQANSRGTSSITLKGKTVSVEYGRPSLNGKTIEQRLAALPQGRLWRLGSNKSTTFKTDIALAFGGVDIPAGEYSIWMQQQPDKSWNLLFDKQHGQWGEPPAAASDCFASVPLKETKAAEPVDLVTINLAKAGKGGTISIQWGTLGNSADFTAK
jgi:hypothetical protein